MPEIRRSKQKEFIHDFLIKYPRFRYAGESQKEYWEKHKERFLSCLFKVREKEPTWSTPKLNRFLAEISESAS